MIKSLPAFIPLYFEEEESDLWQAIQQIEPEMRSAFIKEAMRLALQSHSVGEKFLTHSSTRNLKGDLENQGDRDGIESECENNKQNSMKSHSDSMKNESLEMENFSLEALFAEEHAPELSKSKTGEGLPLPLVEVGDMQLDKLISLQGYQHMMKNIFGTENDEAVLKVLHGLSEQRNK